MRWTTGFLPLAFVLAGCAQAETRLMADGAPETGQVPVADDTTTASGPLAPRNECSSVAGLGTLHDALRQAAQARDADALLALVDPDVLLDFGGGSGREELRTRLTAPDYRLWDEIDRALALGCGLSQSVDGERYASWPWYFSKDIIPLDPYEAMIVTAANVPLREGASAQARQIGAVSWDYVRVTEWVDADYTPVTTRDGREGFMPTERLRSLVDYRLVANETDDGWRITAFVAGD